VDCSDAANEPAGTTTCAAAVVLNRWSVPSNATNPNGTVNDCNVKCSWTDRKTVAYIGQIGAVWSQVYDPVGHDLYVAAAYKRGASLGPLGIGGIYRINDVLDANGNLTPGQPTVDQWANVAAPGGLNINVGTAQSNTARGLNAADGYFADPDGFAKAEKIGIGGMVLDPDSGIIYFVNLNDKKIYGITTGASPTLVGSWATPAGTNQRAFALSLREGNLYVGYNDTGENYPFCPAAHPGNTYTTNNNRNCSGINSAMTAYVAKAALDGTGAPGAWTTVLTVPLDYQKGNPIYNWQGTYDGSDPDTGNYFAYRYRQVLQWNTWTDTWSLNPPGNNNNRSVGFNAATNTYDGWGNPYYVQVYPQPYVASISFDSEGFLTLGLGDRTSTQSGNKQSAADSGEPGAAGNPITFETVSSGDILLAALNTDGTYSLENNGVATGTSAGTRTAASGRTYEANGNEGPGGSEFYYDRQDLGALEYHREGTLGSNAILQGVDEVMSTMMDPLAPIRVGGLVWFNANNGDPQRGYDHEEDEDDTTRSSGFQKGGGIGALALLLRDAPVEIGNRVWYDADMDGIQDADEASINGAEVQLWTADTNGSPVTQIATTTTATVNGQAGTWYFRTEGSDGGTTGFVKDANYVVVFPSGTGAVNLVWPAGMPTPPGFTGLTWAQMQRTTPNATGSTIENDSNPNATTGYAPITVGGGSESDHTIDAGWFGMSTFRIEKAIVGTPPTGKTYTFNITAATNFRGDNRLGSGGPDTPPIVDTISYTLNPGQTITSTEQIPYGYKLTFEEAGISGASVAFSPPLGGDDDHGFLVITPTLTPGGVKVTATNSYTQLQVTKILDPVVTLPPGTTFPIEYQIGTDPIVTTEVTPGSGNELTITGIPLGATVKIREPLVGPYSWGGYIWTSPIWTQGVTTLTQDVNGWVTLSNFSSTTPVEITVTNKSIEFPALPFSGGIGDYLFTYGGGLVLLLGVGFGGWHLWTVVFRRKRRRVAAHRA
ncbi:MAG: hypothetical protein IT191_07455, partial [Microbacteriaceae bacterium]|nr:hypothetical protein [Microbacteriaceae bacterium]